MKLTWEFFPIIYCTFLFKYFMHRSISYFQSHRTIYKFLVHGPQITNDHQRKESIVFSPPLTSLWIQRETLKKIKIIPWAIIHIQNSTSLKAKKHIEFFPSMKNEFSVHLHVRLCSKNSRRTSEGMECNRHNIGDLAKETPQD